MIPKDSNFIKIKTTVLTLAISKKKKKKHSIFRPFKHVKVQIVFHSIETYKFIILINSNYDDWK